MKRYTHPVFVLARPMPEDGDFHLTESSAILKCLANKVGSPAYPKDLQARARVNAVMDWFNARFHHNFGYEPCYDQVLDHFKIADARARAEKFLSVLNDHMLGDGRAYVRGSDYVTV